MDTNNIINNFINDPNPSKESMVNSYYLRDQYMNQTIQQVFGHIISKLCLDPQEYAKNIKNQFKFIAIEKLNKYFESDNNEFYQDLNQEYNVFVHDKLNSPEYQLKQNKFNNLKNYYDQNLHKELYNELTFQELCYLGW